MIWRSRCFIGIVGVLALAAIFGAWAFSQRASLNPDTVRIGMPTAKVRLSSKTFRYNESGHFGTKTQFESKNKDALEGSYSLHCRDGKVFAIEIIYSAGVERNKVLAVVERVTGHNIASSEEHDDKELSIKGCETPSEYFYFDNGKTGVQLDFANHDKNKVSRIYCWSA